MLCEGPVHPVPDVLVNRMVTGVVLEGAPPPVCACHSHQEKVIGRTAVPAPGKPQATVALAVTLVPSMPRIGANQCVVGLSPVTVTDSGALESTGESAVAPPRLAPT